jgi:hypothetical protein
MLSDIEKAFAELTPDQ